MTTQQQSAQQQQKSPHSIDVKRAAAGGIVAALIALVGVIIVNVSSGQEAHFLLEGMLPSIRFLCSAVMTSSATILALMLTMVSVSRGGEGQFKGGHYERVGQIAQVDTITFAAALVLLLFVSIPISESQDVPTVFYQTLYYGIVVYAAVLGGSLISIVLMLYNAIADLVKVLHPARDTNLLIQQQQEEG